MILSVSRRTDIPNYYSEWFYNRIKEGFVYVQNPMNAHQISKIDLSPDVVDCIVFWTKNPEPMLDGLDRIAQYPYYFQFTLTGYGKEIEPNLPHKKERMLPIFQRLSDKIGRQRVIWRYDPIFFTKTYTPEYHFKAFDQIAGALNGYTDKCVISFVDLYAKNKKAMESMKTYEIGEQELYGFAEQLSMIAAKNRMVIASCAETMELSHCGIEHNCCIDKGLIEEITGYQLHVGRDRNQRTECGCVESIDIGMYNTCKSGCRYCYANYSQGSVMKNCACYDSTSPILCRGLTKEDKISERKVKSLKERQLSFLIDGN